MPEQSPSEQLNRLLSFREDLPPDPFVLDVMHSVQRDRQRRRWILGLCGAAGAGFGLLGAAMLADDISRLFTGLPSTATMQAALFVFAGFAFYSWFMNDDLGLHG